MAKRDVELIIKAKDEASRALNSVATELSELDIKQKGTVASGRSMARTLVDLAQQMGQFERVTGLVVAASNRAEAAIDGQRAAITRTASELASVQAQLSAARSAIDKAQVNIVDARLGGGTGAAEVAALQAAQQAARDLEQEQAKLTRTLATQESTLAEQERAFREIAANANTAEAALASFGDESSRASTKVAASAEEAAAALRAQSAAQDEANRAAQARSFFDSEPATAGIDARTTALADMLRAEEAQADSLARLQSRLDPLAAIERKLATETQFLAKAQRDGLLTVKQYEAALEQLQIDANNAREAVNRVGRGEKGKVALFGLKPYELTNLGYQVNDLVTQVASGTSVMQAFAQQGGQILQLMPQIGSRIIAAFRSPPLLIFAASVGAVAVVLKEASDAAESMRRVEGIVSAIGDGAGATAAQLAEVARELDNMGLSADESVDIVRRFVSGGLNTDMLEEFTSTAQNFAQVSGKEIPEAAAEMQSALTKGFDGIGELDDAWQFLTESEREHIRVMFESGDAVGARTQAFHIFQREMEEMASKERGPWAGATRSLGRAFDELLQTLGNSDAAQGFINVLEETVTNMDIALKKTEELTTAQAELQLQRLKAYRAENPSRPGVKHVDLFGGKTIDQEIADLERLIAKRKQASSDNGDLNDAEAAAAKKREADTLAQIRRERELSNARSSADRIRIAGENAYRDEIEKTGNVRIAQARKEAALEKARREEAKRAEQERKKLEAEFADRIAGNGRDQLVSTARGFVGRSENRAGDRAALTDFFKAANVNVDPKMVAWCAAFVNAVLATNGLPTVNQATGGSNLRARDFLTYGSKVTTPEPGDIVILKRGGNSGQGHVGLFQGFTGNGNVRVLGGNQGDGVNTSTFKASDVLGFRRAPSQGDVAEQQAKDELKRLENQRDFNDELDEENAKRQRGIEYAQRLAGLSGEALIEEQRRQAIETAVADARAKALRDDVELSAEREKVIRDTVGAEFNLANARERATAALDDVTTERNALLQRIETAERLGDAEGVKNAEAAVARLDEAMLKAIDHAITLMRTLADTPENRAAIANLEDARDGVALDARDRGAARARKPVDQGQALRNSLLEQIDVFQNLGETGVVDQLREQLRSVDEQLLAAIDSAMAFWQTQTGPEAQAALIQYETLRAQILAAQNEFVISAKQIQDAFASSMVDALDLFAQRISEGRSAIDSLAEAAQSFASSFLRQLSEMGFQLLALKVAQAIGFGSIDVGGTKLLAAGGTLTAAGVTLTAAGGTMTAASALLGTTAALWATTAAAIQAAATTLLVANAAGGAGIFHGGGIAGFANRSRAVHPAWFAAAMRYHSGGVAGLRPNEVPTILERGEEILTRSDPRHRWNRGAETGGGGGGSVNLKAVLVHDPAEALNAALGSSAGEKTMVGFFRRNSATLRAALEQ